MEVSLALMANLQPTIPVPTNHGSAPPRRQRSSLSEQSIPRRAIFDLLLRQRSDRRFSAASYALSAGRFSGRLRGRPPGRLIGSMASLVASILRLACP